MELPDDIVAQLEEASGAGRYALIEVWPENWPAVEAFAEVANQWRIASGGMAPSRFIGLDYAATQAGLELAGMTVSTATWADMRVMEREATAVLNGERGGA